MGKGDKDQFYNFARFSDSVDMCQERKKKGFVKEASWEITKRREYTFDKDAFGF